MGHASYSYLRAGALVRGPVKRSLQQLREWGCTVTFNTESGLLETVYSNIEIEGPDWAIRRFHRWVSDLTGRMV